MAKGIETEELLRDEETTLLPLLQAAEDSKKANIATIRSIVMKVLSDPNVFAGYDQIKAILKPTLDAGGGEGEKLLRSLDLFSYGTYSEFQSNKSQYLDLTGAQVQKLRQLSALSVVQQACVNGFQTKNVSAMIPYKDFESALLMSEPNTGEVEDVLVSCLYMGVFHGKLCQQSQSLHLSPRHAVRPRDVPPSHIPSLVEQIRSIRASLQTATSNLTQQKQKAIEQATVTAAFWQQAEDRRKKNESASMMRWDADTPFGDIAGGGTRRQKRGRAQQDPGAAFARFQA